MWSTNKRVASQCYVCGKGHTHLYELVDNTNQRDSSVMSVEDVARATQIKPDFPFHFSVA